MWSRRLLACLLPGAVVLAGCGSLPRPFAGGAQTTLESQLRRPPPARILVPAPTEAGLTSAAAQRFAEALAESLREQDLPATATGRVARNGTGQDWRVTATMENGPRGIALNYALLDEKGESVGTVRAPRIVPAADWANADPVTITAAATDAGPAIAALTGRADTARRASDPGRVARLPTVAVAAVSGAPGDGNESLTRAMREAAGRRGLILQEEASASDYLIAGTVVTAPQPGGQTRIEIAWRVTQGSYELGKVVQLNEVPARALSGRWGDIAYVVAEEASGGIKQVLDTARESQGRASASNPRAMQPQTPTPPGGISVPDPAPASARARSAPGRTAPPGATRARAP